jgi:HlyD family secretion protein
MTAEWVRRRRWQLALGAVAVAVAGALSHGLLGTQVAAYVVARQDLVARVVASGQVMPPARVTLGTLSLAQVLEVRADEGDRVRAGQLLVQLDDAEARAAAAQARAAVAQAAARLDQLRSVTARVAVEAVRQAELRLEQSEARLRRTEQLSRGGAAPEQELDDARKARDLAASARETAAAQALATAQAGSELRLAVAALDQARAQLAQAESRVAQARLRAPADAVVLTRAAEPGDVVQPGKALLVLARLGETRVSVQPDEKNLAVLRVGQPATAVADAFPGQPFRAEVAFLAPSVDPARGTVEVRLRVPDPPAFLRPDMTVSVNVDVGRRPGALVLAADALRETNGEAWVLAVRDGFAERRTVHVGFRGDGVVEVLDGVGEGDVVVPPSQAGVAAGQRVRARPTRVVELAHAL